MGKALHYFLVEIPGHILVNHNYSMVANFPTLAPRSEPWKIH